MEFSQLPYIFIINYIKQFFNHEDFIKAICFYKWGGRWDCLDLFALNVTTDFLFRKFFSFKKSPSHSAHRSLEPRPSWVLQYVITAQIKKTLTKVKVFFMGRKMGFEPTHIGTTIRGLNHLTTSAISYNFILSKTVSKSRGYFYLFT